MSKATDSHRSALNLPSKAELATMPDFSSPSSFPKMRRISRILPTVRTMKGQESQGILPNPIAH